MSIFKARASGGFVSNTTKQFEEKSTLSIYFPDQDIYIPFLIKGTKCYIPLRTLTEVEVNYIP